MKFESFLPGLGVCLEGLWSLQTPRRPGMVIIRGWVHMRGARRWR